MKKRFVIIPVVLVALVAAFFFIRAFLYARKQLEFTFDAAYYWASDEKNSKGSIDSWNYEKLPAGHSYYLYLPPEYREDKDNEDAKLPLIVVFHGSDEKGAALHKYGEPFVREDFQKKIYPKGAAVLVILSRVNYFTDPHSTSLLIQNIALRNKCIDQTNIIGWGFSQGAKFVVELACAEPRLFRAVISGSGFYHITLKELISVMPVCFYSAVSENDKGIFEQGCIVGRLCGKWCKNSRYVQYQNRGHFYVELKDKTGRGDETVMDWLVNIVNGA